MKSKHLIVISVDALVSEDLQCLDGLPEYGKLIENGFYQKNVVTVYPSLTHAVHASIITGQPAGVTGITGNRVFSPDKDNMPWFNDYSDIRCETILDIAKKAGLVTASCRWPVTAGGGDVIDYLIPEIMAEDMEKAKGDWRRAYSSCGTTPCLMKMVEEAVGRHGSGLGHPEYDEVEIDCACEIIRNYKPNILLTHPSLVDSERHRTGLFSSYVKAAVKKTDEWIGRLIDATKEAGIYGNTDFVVLSDHGHLPYNKIVNLNSLLKQEGLLRTDGEGNVTDWDAYVLSCDLSAQVYLKDPANIEMKERVETLLTKWSEDGSLGIGQVMSAEEAERDYGLKGGFSFVLEGAEGYCFAEHVRDPLTGAEPPEEEGLGHSTHGHLPEKGPKPVFIGSGPDFKEGDIWDGGSILGHFAMFKGLLGLE